ncbi:MAG: hypothetical protein GXY03_07085 [Solirubrobacterales bacterium]|nr:hypothetical protein [Solirubrobacterales bacterium]
MQRLPRADAFEYDMAAREPKLTVAQGERFVLETEDAESGLIRSESDLPTPETLGERWAREESNPVAGPVAVEGARAGDVLAVTIHDIVVDEQGYTAFIPGIGPLHDSARYPDCHGPFTRIVRHLPGPSGTTSDGVGVLDESTRWNLLPHIGTIGTAPLRAAAAGADTVYGQGAHGGNIDCRDISRGNTVLLPVAVDGGLLYAGDVHASQADSEYYGVADETRAELTLSCRVLSGRSIPAPRVVTPESIVQLHSAKPLEDAIGQAFLWMIDWLVEDFGFAPRDAYMHMGINPDVRINVYQMTKLGRLNYTAGVQFPRKQLPDTGAELLPS